ncbi:carbohydrate ABC transporter substrate-binding protein [Phormidium tenue FACHB-886]|nr:carbohydrate ABC transporter substrate-binding protein [Phormidium tenue FACHB-886]
MISILTKIKQAIQFILFDRVFDRPVRRIAQRRQFLLFSLLAFVVVACTRTTQPEQLPAAPAAAVTSDAPLLIWWEKGFNLEEDEALQNLVIDWEKQTGHAVDLVLHTTDDFPQKTQRAIQAGKPPDIVMSHNAERGLYPHLAWAGKLVDVSDVVQPVKALYPESILEAVNLQNQAAHRRSYYAVPFSQSTNFIFYWRDLVEQAGFKDDDIPKDWDQFWNFWKQVQDKLQQKGQDIYGLGFSFSDKAGDTYFLFEQVLEAYDAQLLTPDGTLQADDPTVRQKIRQSLAWYTRFYQQQYAPPDATKWLNPDNNSRLLNRSIVMTPNTSLTIPATVRQDQLMYRKQLGTLEFPNKPSGQPMRHILTIKQAVIFAESKNQAIAKEFLAHLIQPPVLGNYLKAAGIRNQPISKPIWNDPYWTNPEDPHLSVSTKLLNSDRTRPFPSVYHPAYSVVTQENVWGKAINRVVVENVSVEQAVDEALNRIKQIFAEWQ